MSEPHAFVVPEWVQDEARRLQELRSDLRSHADLADTDVRMSEAAKNWTAAIDRAYAERVREVLSAAHKMSMM